MDAQKAGDLLQDLKAELDQLEKATADAERRRNIAKSEADNLESRNRLALEYIEKETAAKQRELEKTLNQETDHLRATIRGLEKSKRQLIDQTADVRETTEHANLALAETQTELAQEMAKVARAKEDAAEFEKQIVNKRAALAGYSATLQESLHLLEDRQKNCRSLEQDKATLQETVDRLEDRVMELDAQFKIRQENLNKQLADTTERLKAAELRLAQAQNEDKAVRRAWAEEHLKLEKRTQTVRNMEASLSDAENRIAELDKYMRL